MSAILRHGASRAVEYNVATMEPEIRFCKSADGTRLALTTFGSANAAPLLVNTAMGFPMDSPFFTGWEMLATRRYLILFDRRGSGSSERNIEGKTLQTEVEDISAVLDHLSLDECVLWGNQDSAPVCAAYAALFPERVSHLILFGGFASGADAIRPEAADAMRNLIRTNWRAARILLADLAFPSGSLEEKELVIAALKDGMSPEEAAMEVEFYTTVDATDYLPRIDTPTLVLHRRGDRTVPVSAAKALAGMIRKSRLVLLDGDCAPASYNYEQYIDTVWEFLGESAVGKAAPKEEVDSILRTVLFTDLVGHTQMMSRLGDERGRAVLREHETITRNVLKTYGGTEVKTMGDGFMASFGSVTKAVECAVALQRAIDERNRGVGARHSESRSGHKGHSESTDDVSDPDGVSNASPLRAPASGQTPVEPISVRVGLNAGEPIEEDGDLFGATVILASRIAAKAEGGEILVADTVRGLCSGKGFLFADRGEFIAKGFEEPVRVYEVRWRD